MVTTKQTTGQQALAALRRLTACANGAGSKPGEWKGALAEAQAVLDRADARPDADMAGFAEWDYCPACGRWRIFLDGECAACAPSSQHDEHVLTPVV